VGTVGPTSKKSGGLLPPLEKLQKLAELAAVVPADSATDLDETGRSWLIRRRLTDEQVAELVELYRSGVGTPALSERFGISKPSVLELLHDRGVRMRRQPLTKTQRALAAQLYEDGLAIKPIAETLGSSFGAVQRVLKAEGVRLRPRPGRRADFDGAR
jgi:transposase-like protein